MTTQRREGAGGLRGWRGGGTVRTYYGNRYSFVFPSPDCNRSHKEEKAQVETNVYADQTTGTVLKKKNEEKKIKKLNCEVERKI